MTDSTSSDEPTPAPPKTRAAQDGTKNRVEWTREQRLFAWSNGASVLNALCAFAAFLILILTLRATQDTLAVSQQSTVEARRQADAAIAQVDLAQKALIASERPWLSVTAENNGPVTFDERGAMIRLRWTLKNHGRIPAQEVHIMSEVYPMNSGNDGYSNFLLVQQRRECDGWARFPLGMMQSRETIFPGEDFTRDVSVVIRQSLMSDVRASIAPATAILINVVGCVLYTFPGSDRRHRTGFAYTLYRHDPEDADHHIPIPIDSGTVPSDGLLLTNRFWGMGPAD